VRALGIYPTRIDRREVDYDQVRPLARGSASREVLLPVQVSPVVRTRTGEPSVPGHAHSGTRKRGAEASSVGKTRENVMIAAESRGTASPVRTDPMDSLWPYF
jgi:hypothetical protein